MPDTPAPDADNPAALPSADAPPAPEMPATVAPAPAVPELSPAACAERLAALFPATFGPAAPQPLKLRIQADIQQRAPATFTRKTLSNFLHRHTTTTAYLRALLAAPQRVDLDGLPAGEVADEHRQAAGAELERRRTLHESRRAAERDAQRTAQRAAQDEAQRARLADDAARRERAALLHAFETSTLTPANFCALKGLAQTELDARLAQARLEREQRPAPTRPDRPTFQGPRPDRPTFQGSRPDRPTFQGPRPDQPALQGSRPDQPASQGARPDRPADPGLQPDRPVDRGPRPARPDARQRRPGAPPKPAR